MPGLGVLASITQALGMTMSKFFDKAEKINLEKYH